MKTFPEFMQENKKRLTGKIDAFNASMRGEKHPILRTMMRDFADLNEGGKMMRGSLVNLGYALMLPDELLDTDLSQPGHSYGESDALAVAFEIFQTSVLIHDDVIDHAALRRGKPTIHTRYRRSLWNRGIEDKAGDTPQSAALCVGDFGLFAADHMIVESYAHDPALPDLLGYFEEIIMDTIRGELLDVVLPYEAMDPTRDQSEREALVQSSVEDIYRLKTAQYSVVGPLHLGLLYGGADEELLRGIDAFGEAAGIGFQIKDDLFGIFGGEKSLGKDVGTDIEEAKMTILYQYVRAHSDRMHRELMRYYGRSPVTADLLEKVREIFRETGALAFAEETMEKCFRAAEEILGTLPLWEEKKTLLQGFIDFLREREK